MVWSLFPGVRANIKIAQEAELFANGLWWSTNIWRRTFPDIYVLRRLRLNSAVLTAPYGRQAVEEGKTAGAKRGARQTGIYRI